jgi:hypothetical protein
MVFVLKFLKHFLFYDLLTNRTVVGAAWYQNGILLPIWKRQETTTLVRRRLCGGLCPGTEHRAVAEAMLEEVLCYPRWNNARAVWIAAAVCCGK